MDPFYTLKWNEEHVIMLDQTLLPNEERYIEIRDVDAMCDAIKRLAVRGAPAIGVAAAMGVALGALNSKEDNFSEFKDHMDSVCSQISATRPTAVNLFWAIDRMKKIIENSGDMAIQDIKDRLVKEAILMETEDRELCERIGRHGKDHLVPGDRVLTHCNAGGLATAGYGTALGVIRAAWESGNHLEVFSDETRPLNQGARITSWELMKLGIPVTLIPDSNAGALMSRGEITKVVVGADRIAANGDTANKIGTYTVAVMANRHKIPFYVAAPLSTIDMALPTGNEIPIEERDATEVTNIGGVRIAPEGVKVRNIAFDVTPHELIAGIITEWGTATEPYEDSFKAFFAMKEAK